MWRVVLGDECSAEIRHKDFTAVDAGFASHVTGRVARIQHHWGMLDTTGVTLRRMVGGKWVAIRTQS